MKPMEWNQQNLARFDLTYSGVDQGRIVMDDGQIVDMSRDEIGIQGHSSVTVGMELALLISLPDSDEHLCVPEARVSWVSGPRFGVTLRTVNPTDHDRLRSFLRQGETATA